MINFTEVKYKQRENVTQTGMHNYTEVWWKDCI